MSFKSTWLCLRLYFTLFLPKMGICYILLKADIRHVLRGVSCVDILKLSCAGLVPTGKTITEPGLTLHLHRQSRKIVVEVVC